MKQKPYVKVYPTGSRWSVKSQGAKRRVKICDTQAEAIQLGRRIAMNRGCELIVHRTDGTIRSKDTFPEPDFPPMSFFNRQLRAGSQHEPDISELADSELPGMWEQADFIDTWEDN